MELRRYQTADCPALAALFYDTVHTVCRRSYTAAQCAAWATGQVDLAAWDRSFRAHVTWVAQADGQIVGFGDIDPTGYLDRLYVHRDFQRQGIASALCDALEAAVPARPVVTHASLTARPFFEARGYRVVRRQEVMRAGVLLANFVMEKP